MSQLNRDVYRITKLGKVDNPYHKDSTYGESQDFHLGLFDEEPKIGYRFVLKPLSYRDGRRGISTTPVTKIIDNNTFETMNSIYKYELYEEED